MLETIFPAIHLTGAKPDLNSLAGTKVKYSHTWLREMDMELILVSWQSTHR